MGDNRGVRIDVRDLLSRAQRWKGAEAGSAGIVNAGFVSFALAPLDADRPVAQKLVIRLRDKRVFTADDCCDECVTSSVAALQQVREALVETQVQLADQSGGQFFWILDWMLVVIRAFLTWEQRVRATDDGVRDPKEHYRSMERTHHVIDQLDIVRAHLRVALSALSSIASLDVPAFTTARIPEPTKVIAEASYVLSKSGK